MNKKQCKTCGELKFIFSKGDCKECASVRYRKKYQENRLEKLKEGGLKKAQKNTYEIKKFSNKRGAKERSYKKVLAQKKESSEVIECQGCLKNANSCTITPSHIVPRSENFELIDDLKNIHWHCQEGCHEKCENGRFWELRDGLEIMEYLWLNSRFRFFKWYLKYNENKALFRTSKHYNDLIHESSK